MKNLIILIAICFLAFGTKQRVYAQDSTFSRTMIQTVHDSTFGDSVGYFFKNVITETTFKKFPLPRKISYLNH